MHFASGHIACVIRCEYQGYCSTTNSVRFLYSKDIFTTASLCGGYLSCMKSFCTL